MSKPRPYALTVRHVPAKAKKFLQALPHGTRGSVANALLNMAADFAGENNDDGTNTYADILSGRLCLRRAPVKRNSGSSL